MTKLIPRNTTVPTSKSETFSTAADGQTSVDINVLQGEREFVRDNKSLGSFRLDGIPPAPRGVPQIDVSFNIDASGILSVSATDKGSGKKADIQITGASTLAKEDVDRMVEDAEKFAEEDTKKREAIDTRNLADSMVYQARKQLSVLGGKLLQNLRCQIETNVDELEKAIRSEDMARIKTSMDSLQRVFVKIGQVVYNQQGVSDPNIEPRKKVDSDVIDADFTDKT